MSSTHKSSLYYTRVFQEIKSREPAAVLNVLVVEFHRFGTVSKKGNLLLFF